MDVMRPDVYRIGKKFYRRNPLNAKFLTEGTTSYRPYEEEDPSDFRRQFDEGESSNESADLKQLSNGSWRLALAIPCQLFPALVGRRAETKKRLEVDTRTQLTIPRQGEQGPVIVQGMERRSVLSARSQISLLCDAARLRQPFSHFLSLAIAEKSPPLIDAFADFQARVLDLCGGDRGVSESLFQTPSKLHLTLGVLTLLDDREVATAAKVLEDACAELNLTSGSLLVDCEGLEYMNDDPTEVDVLYMKVSDPAGCLQTFADSLIDRFVKSGLVTKEFPSVKLHVTLMNTLFRREPGGASGEGRATRGRPPRESFDASGLLRRFGDFEFAKGVPISRVQLSQRFSIAKNGYYGCAASVDL